MSLGINDTFNFGKYKGRSVAEVLRDDVRYCCWLREEKKNAGQPRPFNSDVNMVIDQKIRDSKTLQKKYKPLNATDADLQQMFRQQAEDREVFESLDQRRAIAYSGEWGAW